MSASARRAAALLVTVLLVAMIVTLSRAPWPVADDRALLRLSWSGRPERIERCRELSDAELARIPAHMRQRVECEGSSAQYLVRVWHGASLLSQDTLSGGGFRGDRAIYMLREYRLAPGTQQIAVEMARTDSTEVEDEEPEDESEDEDTATAPLERSRRERQERRRELQERLPPVIRLDTSLRLAPRDVVVVTYDPIGRRLLTLTQ